MARVSNKLLLILSVVLSLLVCEGLARGYVYMIAMRGKLYRAEPELGYTLRSNIQVRRKNAEGKLITVRTDAVGSRISAINGETRDKVRWRPGRRRVLIVGDSFAEGQVEFEDRFDQVLARIRNDLDIRTLGAGGYGTDQELLLAQRFFKDLREGDVFILLTCGNDFYDILQDSLFGRTKPYFTLEENKLIHHPPSDSFWYRLRDTSYLIGYIMEALDSYELSPEKRGLGRKLYKQLIISFLTPLKQKGVRVIIAHHSDWLSGDLSDLFIDLRKKEFDVFNIDLHVQRNAGYHLSDMHWNERGNNKVAEVLSKYL